MTRLFLAPLLAFALAAPLAAEPEGLEPPRTLDCQRGPLKRSFGETSWLVHGCADKVTMVVAAAEDNPGKPFFFVVYPVNGAYQIHAEGSGDRAATQPAWTALSALSPPELRALAAEAAGE